jgi:hypothetical protein
LTLNREFNTNWTLKFGTEYFNRKFNQKNQISAEAFFQQYDFREKLSAAFAESDIYLTKHLLARIGLRSEYISLNNKLNLSPRLSLALKTSEKSQISAAFGQFNQTPRKEWLMIANELAQEKATHYILNYQYNASRRTFRIEMYYKKYEDLVSFTTIDPINPELFKNDGLGFARGLDLFWRDNQSFPNIDYWISYSFLDTKRRYRDYPESAVPPFASRHNFSIVYKHFISEIKSQLGLSCSYSSSRTYHDPNQSKFMAGRTPDYYDLSGNFSYLMRDNVIIHLSASNLLGLDQVFGYEYSSTPNAEGVFAARAIRPPAKRFIFLGVFITFSKESVMNQLPNL